MCDKHRRDIQVLRGTSSKQSTKQCQTKLTAFIDQQHGELNIMFWPNLASCHHARDTLNSLKNDKIEARPTEVFSTVLNKKVYDEAWQTGNKKQLRKICRKLLYKVYFLKIRSV